MNQPKKSIAQILSEKNGTSKESKVTITEEPQSENISDVITDNPILEKVVEREYSKNPDAVLDKIIESSKQAHFEAENPIPEPLPIPEPIQEPIQEKKSVFAFFKEEPKPEPKLQLSDFEKYPEPIPEPKSEIPFMQFDTPIESMDRSASDTVKEKIGSTTSDFIWRNIKNGLPEILGNYVVKVDSSIADKSFLPGELTVAIKEEIEKRNKDNKHKLEIPQWHEDNILPVLEEFCIEKGIQQSIPVGLQLAIGVLFLVGLFVIPTVMEIKKSNNVYISKIEALLNQYQPKKEPKETKEDKEEE